MLFFFFQAEDGIRDLTVTGVQTCALPIFNHDGYPDLYIANGMISGTSRDDLNSFFWRQVVANSRNDPRPSHEYEQGWNAINELIRSDHTWSGFERNVFYLNKDRKSVV